MTSKTRSSAYFTGIENCLIKYKYLSIYSIDTGETLLKCNSEDAALTTGNVLRKNLKKRALRFVLCYLK